MKVLLLTRYGVLGASSRLRTMQYIPALRSLGIDVTVAPLLRDRYLERLYGGRRDIVEWPYALLSRMRRLASTGNSAFDLIWIEKEALPWLPGWLEKALLPHTPYILDYDDAIFHNYDLNRSTLVRALLGRKFAPLMRGASAVVAGNDYLGGYAKRLGAQTVEIIPTVVDLDRYAAHPIAAEPACHGRVKPVSIGWIGSPVTSGYLLPLQTALLALRERNLPFNLTIIGGGAVKLWGIPTRRISWHEATEVAELHKIDIGIMPLPDEPWERGKCGYKLIQYMACGKPVVASPVGVNELLVKRGVTGFLAADEAQWIEHLGALVRDGAMRTRMGAAGRHEVELHYSVQANALRMAALMEAAVRGGRRTAARPAAAREFPLDGAPDSPRICRDQPGGIEICAASPER